MCCLEMRWSSWRRLLRIPALKLCAKTKHIFILQRFQFISIISFGFELRMYKCTLLSSMLKTDYSRSLSYLKENWTKNGSLSTTDIITINYIIFFNIHSIFHLSHNKVLYLQVPLNPAAFTSLRILRNPNLRWTGRR